MDSNWFLEYLSVTEDINFKNAQRLFFLKAFTEIHKFEIKDLQKIPKITQKKLPDIKNKSSLDRKYGDTL